MYNRKSLSIVIFLLLMAIVYGCVMVARKVLPTNSLWKIKDCCCQNGNKTLEELVPHQFDHETEYSPLIQ